MSVWAHVAATFRYDGVDDEFMSDGAPDWDKVFGCCTLEPIDYTDEEVDAWIESVGDAYDHPDDYVPFGSEGSLQRTVWVNPCRSHAARYTVTVFGDLRDYDDVDAIHRWFDRSCERGMLRQAVCHVNVEGRESATWEHDFVFSDRELEEYLD